MPTNKAELDKIAQGATTPLNPDESENLIFTWHQTQQELPQPKPNTPSESELLWLATTDNDYTAGFYNFILSHWQTDLGVLDTLWVTHWARIIPPNRNM